MEVATEYLALGETDTADSIFQHVEKARERYRRECE